MSNLNYKVLLILLAVLTMPVQAAPPHQKPIHDEPPPPYAPDRVLVSFKPGTAAPEQAAAHLEAGGHTLKTITAIGVHVVSVPIGTVLEKVKLYEANPNVLYAELDFNRILRIPNETSNDPLSNDFGLNYFEEQWGLDNFGQLLTNPETGEVSLQGSFDADIDAPEGWDISTGDPGVVIAILDTGVDCSGNLEFVGKCVDEQNFVSLYSSTTSDIVTHGTHTAGIAAANTDNQVGVAGVGWNSSIANLKTCYEYEYDLCPELGIGCYVLTGICPVSASAEAITYAADHNYSVISMSYASDVIDPITGEPLAFSSPPNAESAAVTYAWDQGSVLVAAAGNNNDTTQVYPAALPEVIAVAATNRYDDRASFSTFGNTWVSMMAPGENIISTVPNDQCIFYADVLSIPFDPNTDACLDWYSGTSMAAPHVAGAAGLVWAHLFLDQLLNLDPADGLAGCVDVDSSLPCNVVVRNQLESGADTTGALGQNFLAWSQHGRLSLAGALGVVPPPVLPPLAPSGLSVFDNADGTATLSWTDNSSYETAFEIDREKERKNGTWGGSTLLTTNPNTTSMIDQTGVGTFRHRVRALGDAGPSDWTGWVQVIVTDLSGGGKGNGSGKGGGKKAP